VAAHNDDPGFNGNYNASSLVWGWATVWGGLGHWIAEYIHDRNRTGQLEAVTAKGLECDET